MADRPMERAGVGLAPKLLSTTVLMTALVAGGALGCVHVGMDRAAIEREVAGLRWSLLGLGAGVALVGAVFGLIVTLLLVVRPIRALTRVTEAIVSSGDLRQEIAVSS